MEALSCVVPKREAALEKVKRTIPPRSRLLLGGGGVGGCLPPLKDGSNFPLWLHVFTRWRKKEKRMTGSAKHHHTSSAGPLFLVDGGVGFF